MLRAWGDDGLDAHLRGVQREYAQRAACIAAAAHKVGGSVGAGWARAWCVH